MAELYQLQEQEIPKAMEQLQESHNNLKKVADYCEGNYLQADALEKRPALDETRSYTTQALASVAYQINTLATSFLSLLDLQARQLVDMESSINHLAQTVSIHKEKVARREIGVLTTSKTFFRPLGVKSPGIIFPEQPEKSIKYVRKPIDYTMLDSVGNGGPKVQMSNHRNTRPGSVSSASSSSHGNVPRHSNPPSAAGTLTRGRHGAERGTTTIAPPVEPPTVPSHYMSAQQLQLAQQSGAQASLANPTYGHVTLPPPVPSSNPMSANGRTESPYSTAGHHMYNGSGVVQPPSPISPPLPPMPTPHDMYNNQGRPSPVPHYRYYVPNMPPPLPDDIPSPPPPPEEISVQNVSNFPEYNDQTDGYYYDDVNSVSFPPPIPSTNVQSRVDPPWAPENYLEKVVAIFDYTPANDDELQFRENVILYVIKKNSDGWWEGVMESDDGSPICGLFPENYVESLL